MRTGPWLSDPLKCKQGHLWSQLPHPGKTCRVGSRTAWARPSGTTMCPSGREQRLGKDHGSSQQPSLPGGAQARPQPPHAVSSDPYAASRLVVCLLPVLHLFFLKTRKLCSGKLWLCKSQDHRPIWMANTGPKGEGSGHGALWACR